MTSKKTAAIDNLVAHGLPRDFAEGMVEDIERAILSASAESAHGTVRIVIEHLRMDPFASMTGREIADDIERSDPKRLVDLLSGREKDEAGL